jgi:chemotaxis protein MotB
MGRVAVGVLLLVFASCKGMEGSSPSEAQAAENRNLQDVNDAQKERINQLTAESDALDRRVKELEAKVAKTGNTQQAVEQAKGEMSESVRRVMERFKGDNQIEVVRDGSGYRFILRESVLFGSGSSSLSDDGKRALGRVGDALRGGNTRISVEGHTDNVPIAKDETRKRYPRGNIELSVDRAFAVYDWLIKDGGVEESRVAVVGFGEYRPVAPNTNDMNKWRNRRVEIRVEER